MNKLNSKMMEMYPELMNYLNQNNLDISGPPFAIYHESESEGYTILECGLPIKSKIEGKDKINFFELPY